MLRGPVCLWVWVLTKRTVAAEGHPSKKTKAQWPKWLQLQKCTGKILCRENQDLFSSVLENLETVWQQQPEPLLPNDVWVDLMWGKKGTGIILIAWGEVCLLVI